MKLLKMKMYNFLSYTEQQINFSSMQGIIFLVGRINEDVSRSNGSGKSAIFDSVEWCLFGVSRTSSDDELIQLGKKEVMVSLDFELDSKCYEIVRTKKYGKSQTLAFTNVSDNIKLTGNSVKESQSSIVKVLGLDSELYETAIFSKQGEIDKFPKQAPANRKDMLRDILKINEYEIWENQAKELSRTYDQQYEQLNGAVNQLQKEIGIMVITELDIEKKKYLISELQNKAKDLQSQIDVKNNMYSQINLNKQLLDKEQDNLEKITDDIGRVKIQIQYLENNAKQDIEKILKEKNTDLDLIKDEERINKVLHEVSLALKDEESARLQYESLVQQDSLLDNELKRILGMMKSYEDDVNKLRNKLSSFRELKDKCPTCLSIITPEQRKVVEDEIVAEGKSKKEYKDKLTEEYNDAKETSVKLKVQIKSITFGVGRMKELESDKTRYEQQLLNIQAAKNRVEYADTKIEEAKNSIVRQRLELNFELKRKETDFSKSQSLIVEYKSKLGNVEKIESEIHELNKTRQTYIDEEKRQTNELGKMEYELETKKKKEQELVMNTMKLEKVKSDRFVYSELTRAFGKNGIPLLVIENALAELQSEVMNQLNILTDGTISVEFRTQKELKSGKQSDTLDILVSDRSGTRDFNLYSGGEKMRVALAIRLGLSKLLSRRAGKKFDILIVDEISDLDLHGMNKFVDLINLVAKDYQQIFIVSHINELKDRFGQIIQVVKDKEGSRIV